MTTFKARFYQPSKTEQNIRLKTHRTRKTNARRKFQQINNLPQLPVESNCGSLYPATGHNQSNQQIAFQNVYNINKRMEQENNEL